MSYFERYFSKEFLHLEHTVTPIKTMIDEKKEYVLISGDFFGIQSFIFDGLSTKNASKVLRAKSAYVQIMIRILSYRLCDELDIPYERILTTSAGKFEILSSNTDQKILESFQKKVEDFFIEKFFGVSGVNISWVACHYDDFGDKTRFRALRDRVAQKNEEVKFHKFSLERHSALLEYDASVDNASLCRVCNLRKITSPAKEHCDICGDYIYLGEKLTKVETLSFVRADADIDFFHGYGITFDPSRAPVIETFDIAHEPTGQHPYWPIRSYLYSVGGAIADLSELASASIVPYDNEKRGVEALGVLKADVDDMGKFIRENDVSESYEKFSTFSQGLDAFFSREVPRLMEEKYPHTYTVFAGGDDLFLIGAWSEIVALGRDVSDAFRLFSKGKLTLSEGIVLVKPSVPVSYLAHHSEEALESSKALPGKDAITLFGETVKHTSYRAQHATLYRELVRFEETVFPLPTTLLYRLLELLRMRLSMEDATRQIEGALWKSKLNYTFRRNVFDRISKQPDKQEAAMSLLKVCDDMIENHPKETKMTLSELIYKRRKA